MTARLLCPVRGCGETLDRAGSPWRCGRGHAFDLARSGYCNLLQPQDRRSAQPGDPPEALAARRRLVDAGLSLPLHTDLHLLLEAGLPGGLGPGASLLDCGCGEGTFLGALTRETAVEGFGLDLSARAADLAARRFPEAVWIVANADRSLPFAAGTLDAVVSVDARLHPEEMRRVLRPEGALLLAVPAPDDLVELRAAVLGEGEEKDRFARAEARLAGHFELERRAASRHRAVLTPALAADALAATYRGGRKGRLEAVAALAPLEVTSAHDLGLFRPRPR